MAGRRASRVLGMLTSDVHTLKSGTDQLAHLRNGEVGRRLYTVVTYYLNLEPHKLAHLASELTPARHDQK